MNTLQLWQIWLCLENNIEYQVIDLADQEVVASMEIKTHTGTMLDSHIWLSPAADFLAAFKFVKMGPKPKGV